ncbi:MAG TPA: glutathione S-transferase family protein [Kofleriaceae bacterium]|nr:glutathione S-transferase family protein [Kofleriaceae bacterium]
MNQVTLIGPWQSSYVRTARICCQEKGVTHGLEPLEMGTEAHTRQHPWGRVPILRHGDLQLIETSAICRYLDATFDGPRLVPTGARQAAVMEQWISAINCYVYDHAIRNYALQYIVPGLRSEPPNRAVIDENVPAMQRDLRLLDAAYGKSEWIAGDAISLADLFVAPIIATARMFPEAAAAMEKCRNLSRAFEALSTRESFAAAHTPA